MLDLRRLTLLGQGCECTCYALSRGRVLKTFRTAFERDRAWSRQKKAYRAGIAPPTLGILDSRTRYGYVSARVTEIGLADGGFLRRPMNQIGLSSHDLRPDNIGKWKGRVVAIDFGDLSMNSWRLGAS